MFSNALTEALSCLQRGEDQHIEVDMALQWDPVGSSCTGSSHILEPFPERGITCNHGNCVARQFPSNFLYIGNRPCRFALECFFFNGKLNVGDDQVNFT